MSKSFQAISRPRLNHFKPHHARPGAPILDKSGSALHLRPWTLRRSRLPADLAASGVGPGRSGCGALKTTYIWELGSLILTLNGSDLIVSTQKRTPPNLQKQPYRVSTASLVLVYGYGVYGMWCMAYGILYTVHGIRVLPAKPSSPILGQYTLKQPIFP